MKIERQGKRRRAGKVAFPFARKYYYVYIMRLKKVLKK